MNLDELQIRADAAEKLLKAMASRPRLMILCELLKGERTVTALHQAVGLSMSAISQHLARLRADELVTTRRESQTIHYSIASEPAKTVIGTLYELYCSPATINAEIRGECVIMTIDRAVMAFAGLVVLVSLALAQTLSPLWLLLTAFVGLNLIQASFTGFCPAAMVFKWLGVKPGKAFT